MYTKFAHRDVGAWDMGDLAYDLGDTLEIGVMKAAQVGIKPCSDEYAAFMTAFGRRVRSRQVSLRKQPANMPDMTEAAPPAGSNVWHAA